MSGILMRGGVVFVLAVAGVVEFARAELVTNGGFETGEFFPWTTPPLIPNQQYWVLGNASAHSGTWYAALSSTNLQYMGQLLPTTAGSDYELSFWLRRSSASFGEFRVRWEGQVIFDQFLSNPDNLTWRHFTLPLHSNITGSLLQFGQNYFPGEFHLDDVSVLPAPAPSAAPLLGLASLVALRRKRRG